jgi:hypothetical protein
MPCYTCVAPFTTFETVLNLLVRFKADQTFVVTLPNADTPSVGFNVSCIDRFLQQSSDGHRTQRPVLLILWEVWIPFEEALHFGLRRKVARRIPFKCGLHDRAEYLLGHKNLSDSGLVIHYQALDPLYWSLVDIMDSILYRLCEPRLIEMHAVLKADLATLLRSDLPATTDIFFRDNYPDLAPENRKPFLNELPGLLECSDSVLPEFNAMMLKGMLQAGRNLPSLDFIEGFTPYLLIESFGIFYLTRIAIFKYSSHILDMEDSVRDEIEAMQPSSNGVPVMHYRFSDSKSEPGIQVSDIVVGLIGKMHSYFAQNSREEVFQMRASLVGASLRNTKLISELIDASHDSNTAFLNHVSSIDNIDKMNLFLRSSGSTYQE